MISKILHLRSVYHRHKLEDANKRIEDLMKLIQCKEKEMAEWKAKATEEMDEICIMKADLEKCYETHKKLHCENQEMKKARQEMLMSTEKLKNELETWKTLHDTMKERNDHLKRQLKAVQCEDHPNNIKKLQELLEEQRQKMDSQIHKIASMQSELAMTKEQLCKYKQALEEQKRATEDPIKRYVEKACELEKITRYSSYFGSPTPRFSVKFDDNDGPNFSSWPIHVDSSDMDLE